MAIAADSSVAGFLAPADDDTLLEDDELDDLLQGLVACITGLPSELVRPRWQPEPPNQPDFEVTWCAIGIVGCRAESQAWIGHFGDGDGYDELRVQEELEILVTTYGPDHQALATLLRDGLQVRFNRESLTPEMNLTECDELGTTTELVKERWLGRSDMRVIIARQVRRIYPVLNLLEAAGVITAPPIAVRFDTANQRGN